MSSDSNRNDGNVGIPVWGLVAIITVSILLIGIVLIIIYLCLRKKQLQAEDPAYRKIAEGANEESNYAQVELASSSKSSRGSKNKKKAQKLPPEQLHSPIYADVREVKTISETVKDEHGYANIAL